MLRLERLQLRHHSKALQLEQLQQRHHSKALQLAQEHNMMAQELAHNMLAQEHNMVQELAHNSNPTDNHSLFAKRALLSA